MPPCLWKKLPIATTMATCFRHVSPHFQHEARRHTMIAEEPTYPPPDTGTTSAGSPLNRDAAGHQLPFESPLIAVYGEPHIAPSIVRIDNHWSDDDHIPSLIDTLATRAYDLAREQGGVLPMQVFRELVENLIHADFAGVVVTILDHGNTIRISDRGPGIPDKEAALRRGFTSADARSRRFIRGVGSGLSVVNETLTAFDGVMEIEDNLGRGTVITVRARPQISAALAPTTLPAYNLSERRFKTLLLTVELAPVGPTRIAQELGVSTSTAYRDLVFLEEAGLVASEATGHRSATEAGLAYLGAAL